MSWVQALPTQIMAGVLGCAIAALLVTCFMVLRWLLENEDNPEAVRFLNAMKYVLGPTTSPARASAVVCLFFGIIFAWGYASGSFSIALVIFMAGLASVFLFGRVGAAKYNRKLEETLPEALQQIANEMASTGSLERALDAVSVTAPSPAREELILLKSRIEFLGVPEALDRTARHLDSESFSLMSAVIRVGTQQGGKLQVALKDLSVTLMELERMRQQVKTATAGSRRAMTFMTIAALVMPYVTVTYLSNGGNPLSDPKGRFFLTLSVLIAIFAYALFLRTIRIRV